MGTLGYCDIFSKCRSVDGEGPLSRLKKFLLNPNTLSQLQIWIRVILFKSYLQGGVNIFFLSNRTIGTFLS